MPEPPLSPEGYAATAGTSCPACGGTALAWGMFFPKTTATVQQEIECRRCRASWTAVYTLTGYEGLTWPTEASP